MSKLSVRRRIQREIQEIRRLLSSLTAEEQTAILQNLENASEQFAYDLLLAWRRLFMYILMDSGEENVAKQILRKFNDAGRRSPPWRPGSARPGAIRPQDGADGNRRNRWLFGEDHEFFATMTMACFVELKYVLQTFSMLNAPPLPDECRDFIEHPILIRILGHRISPGAFLDPLTKETPDLNEFKRDRRYIESGHIVPHGRGGRHIVDNSTLMLRSSNRMQADFTIQEAVENMVHVLRKHDYTVVSPNHA